MTGDKRPLNKEDIEMMMVMIDWANQKKGMFGNDFVTQASKNLSRVEAVSESAVRQRAQKAKVAARRFMAGEKVRWETAFGGSTMLAAPAGDGGEEESTKSAPAPAKTAATKKRKPDPNGAEDSNNGEGPSSKKGAQASKKDSSKEKQGSEYESEAESEFKAVTYE